MVDHLAATILSSLNEWEQKNAPEKIYSAGDVSLLNKGLRVSVVGSRKPTSEGRSRARVFARALAERGITVVSGLAEGIDTVAHEAAIEAGGRTIAVLGTPLSEAYPKSNKRLLETIKKDHLAISQFAEGHPIRPQNFPQRNRTMALISDATVIVEASESSGTKHQGWEAIRLGRLVFLLENVAEDPDLSWPREMIEYGAQVINRNTLDIALENIPHFTEREENVF